MNAPKLIILLLGGLMYVIHQPVSAQGSRIDGDWQGSLNIQSFELRIVFHLQLSKEGKWKATMDSPDQGASGIVVDSVFFENDNARLVVNIVRGEYEGNLEEGDSAMAGTWRQSGVTFPLNLKKTSTPVVVNRPQEPKSPYPYDEEAVSFPNSEAGISLAGTLTLPKSGAPFAAAVLISGSGQQDRDENIFNHKPFKVIADYLSKNGVAVLRYDDRGKGGSTGDFALTTSIDFATDAKAAVAYLQTRKEIDRGKIGLIGHSEGGLIAPIVASKSHDISFIVLLAGPSLMGKDIILLQDSLISLANGVGIDKIRKNQQLGKKMYSIVESEKDTSILRAKLRSYLRSAATELGDTSAAKEQIEAGIERTAMQISSPWFRFFLFYDPVPALTRVKCPVLALNGEKDLQVPARVNLEGIKRAADQGGNSRVTTTMLPDLNHLFQHASTGSPAEYAKIEETFAPEALAIINDWIHSVLRLKKNNVDR